MKRVALVRFGSEELPAVAVVDADVGDFILRLELHIDPGTKLVDVLGTLGELDADSLEVRSP